MTGKDDVLRTGQKLKFQYTDKWYSCKLEYVLKKGTYKILLVFKIQMEH